MEVFDAARYARHIALSLWLCSDKGFGHALGINAAPEAMQLSKSWMREETEVGGEAMRCAGSPKVCPVLARELMKGKGGRRSTRRGMGRDR